MLFALVVAAVAFGAYGLTRPPTVRTSHVTGTTTVFQNVEMAETCTAVNYILPDWQEATSFRNVTIISGSSTYTQETYTVSSAGETTLYTTTYTTSTYTNGTTGYTTTMTSQNADYDPSYEWAVTACTFSPEG